VIVRAATARDHASVRALLVAAFPTPVEADLVAALRADGDAVVESVAVEAAGVFGHVLLSRMRAPARALGLAPLAVAADHRRRGVAARLVTAALQEARAAGWGAAVVLGDPGYYGRFGFSATAAAGFASPYAGPCLMALALAPGGLPPGGVIDYAPAFDTFG
jgi:putative acetyltransferase